MDGNVGLNICWVVAMKCNTGVNGPQRMRFDLTSVGKIEVFQSVSLDTEVLLRGMQKPKLHFIFIFRHGID